MLSAPRFIVRRVFSSCSFWTPFPCVTQKSCCPRPSNCTCTVLSVCFCSNCEEARMDQLFISVECTPREVLSCTLRRIAHTPEHGPHLTGSLDLVGVCLSGDSNNVPRGCTAPTAVCCACSLDVSLRLGQRCKQEVRSNCAETIPPLAQLAACFELPLRAPIYHLAGPKNNFPVMSLFTTRMRS